MFVRRITIKKLWVWISSGWYTKGKKYAYLFEKLLRNWLQKCFQNGLTLMWIIAYLSSFISGNHHTLTARLIGQSNSWQSGDSDIQEYLNNSNQVIGENMETIIYRSVWKDKNKVKEAKNGRYLKEKKLRWTCLKIHFLYYCYYYLRRSCFEIRFKAREWNFVFVFRNGRYQVSKISGTSRR